MRVLSVGIYKIYLFDKLPYQVFNLQGIVGVKAYKPFLWLNPMIQVDQLVFGSPIVLWT